MHRQAPNGIAATLFLAALCACGDDAGTAGGGSPPVGGAGGEAASGGGGALEGGGGTGQGGAEPFVPTPEDVEFQSVNPMPLGEWILFNDWSPSPNELLAMRPDGTNEVTIFRAYRIWSMGISSDKNKLAFSAGDPAQSEHYGIDVGDAIQPTFLYDAILESAENLTYGNINDECHRFSEDDAFLYMCRRYDFTAEGTANGYRIGRLDMATKAFSWITELDPMSMTLNPEPDSAETMLFTRIPIPGTRSIQRASQVDGSGEEPFIEEAGVPVLSPDRTKLLFHDYTKMGALTVMDLETMTSVLVVEGPDLSTGRWSPDGASIAFLRWDDAATCSHVEVAKADGSQPATRIHDCSVSGRSVTELEWVLR